MKKVAAARLVQWPSTCLLHEIITLEMVSQFGIVNNKIGNYLTPMTEFNIFRVISLLCKYDDQTLFQFSKCHVGSQRCCHRHLLD